MIPKVRVTDGTSQEDRYPAALKDDWFRLDERPLADLIARTVEYAEYIRFCNAENGEAGNWRDLFRADEAVALAEILATDFLRMEGEFLPLLARSVRDAALYLLGFARRIDRLYRRLAATDGAGQTASRALVDWQSKSARLDVAAVLRGVAGNDLGYQFADVWGAPTRVADYAAPPSQAGGSGESDRSKMSMAFYTFLHAMSAVKPMVTASLQHSLRSGDHDPSMALFLSFAQLFERAREKANRFTARHRDFYYKKVLCIAPRPATPDCTFLVFERDGAGDPLLLRAGTEFTAGKGKDGIEVVYRSDADLEVTDVKVASLLTLQYTRNPLESPENQLGFVDAARTNQLSLVPAQDKTPPLSFTGAESGSTADEGFAIACESLAMSDGSRKINVTIQFQLPATDASSAGSLMRAVILGRASADQLSKFKALRKGTSPNDLLAQDPREMFQRVFGTAFRIDFTTGSGWWPVSEYDAETPVDAEPDKPCCVSFRLELGPEVPPLTGCSPSVHGAAFGIDQPILRFRFSPDADVYARSLLKGLRLQQITVLCEVADAANVLAWNDQGRLDTTKPFLPFGPLPGLNSFLILGNYESARANLVKLQLDVEWGNLPADFAQYYGGYKNDYRRERFVAQLSVLRDGRWFPAASESEAAPLFQTQQDLSPLVAKYFRPLPSGISEEQFLYDRNARNGFVRIAPIGPAYGFGQSEYPTLLTEVLSENAHGSKWFSRRPRPLPNPPYTPLINRVTVSYSALSTIGPGLDAASNGTFFRIEPFGVEAVDTSKDWTIVRNDDYEGNLFIGLSAKKVAGVLTLLFRVREDASTSVQDAQQADWFYLADEGWKQFTREQILADSTVRFLTSGIVSLDLPNELSVENPIMPKGLYWLRVSAAKVQPSFSGIYRIQSQAVTATRRLQGDPALLDIQTLAANSITAPVVSIPALRSVQQPLPSFGGAGQENERQLVARASARLRHRYRAVTPWDFERLVLENFPDVLKVKCFRAMTTPRHGQLESKPGSLMVVVVPHPRHKGLFTIMDPMLNASRLTTIQEFLRELKSPFAEVEVRNPLYEEIVVNCKISLKAQAATRLGLCLTQINQAIVDYLSPWSAVGPKPRFGWTFANSEVEGYIRRLKDVVSVGEFSMLRITRGHRGNEWMLEDTARDNSGGVSWQYPWSLAIPAQKHNIKLMVEMKRSDELPHYTAIGSMQIGRTFIITA
ncbi:MAG TPA: hypothetical protein VHZ55_04015 [Bryobacteraceae bacterium]|jgi:hypothetical protein|nr:hypothetical protein [Bryobacteraceae bacterium]